MSKYRICVLVVALCSCTAPKENESKKIDPTLSKLGNGEAAATHADKDSTTSIGPDNEMVSIPSRIAGALLTCAIRKEASPSDLETEIGCRLEDPSTQMKMPGDTRLSFKSDGDKIVSEPQPEAALYHVLYRVRGESVEAIHLSAESAQAIAMWDKINFKAEKIYNILKPAISLDDFEAPIVRAQSIDPDARGSL